jgi:Fic family protein
MTLQPTFHITHQMTSGLTQIERARGFLEAARLSEDWLARMRSRALLLEAHHTTHIEGTRLTLDEAERLLAGHAVPSASADDVRELLNYRGAFELVSAHLNDGGPLTEALIREIHQRLVAGVRGGAAQPGEYRRVQNFVVNSVTRQIIYTPPAPSDVPALMAELLGWLNADSEIHPVLVAGIAQFQLVHVHPFLDGNGRTSRLLSTLCLYRAGYDFKRLFSLSEFYDLDRPAFYAAIQSVREQGMDLTRWLDYFVEGLATQMDEVALRGKKVIRADVLARQYHLNPRQDAAFRFVLERGTVSIRDLGELWPQVSRRTLQRDLNILLENGLIREVGSARTDPNRFYEVGEGLDEQEL